MRPNLGETDGVKIWNYSLQLTEIEEAFKCPVIPKAAPDAANCTVPQAEARLKRLEDEILTQLHTLNTR